LRQPGVTSCIVGASSLEQIEENAGASGVMLSAETIARIEAAMGPA